MGYGSRIKYYGEESSVAFKIVDIFIISMILFTVSEVYLGYFASIYQLILSLFVVVYFVISDVAGVYRPYKYLSFKQNFFAILMTWSICVALSLIVGFFLKISEDYSRLVTGLWFVLTPLCLVGWRWLVHGMFRVVFPGDKHRKKAIIIGATRSGIQLANELKLNRASQEVLVGFYDDRSLDRIGLHRLSSPLRGKIDDALMLAKSRSVQKVYIALPMEAAKRIKQILNAFADSNAHVYVVPDFFTFDLMQSRLKSIGKVVTLSIYDTPFYGFTSLIKRIEDIILASIIITLISPVLLFVAVGVKLSSPGPVIFKQERYGLDGKPIKVWKFRSMRVMDNGSVVKQATKNDPRVTRFGAFIRRTSLDELPQFINVITGQMSIVGPRPHAVAHNEEYRGLIDKYMLRHHVKPGITGWAQINGYRGETDTLDKMEKRVEFDLSYIQTWSLWLDLKIIFLTVFKGFVGKTAY
ncbi:undecaprenyl-phosphate glucose phosphotransferase [Vibrio mangrovi]|uniref:UDP-glucose:undecaprenyl-phosphate glucose-1-phosphate transferase n=1 Tax=Vibrio mangrovi TaxID=474394 RepID=A0A1Y6IUL6_9VIBR|nr:undecaprenyl-phosphate glucose phosphotransferase [Vibrio mangrovi]MDW6003084.1 undecaprenyl-phosphate glucose phosphotransferase [Vibrio mangrovi]SMS01326.1 UDP-glucose:undecaprenyl-phosphate glucose-1-phosphate transferase [Vibrio mangrovi]